MIRKFAEKIFNISAHELPRVSFVWFVRFLHNAGFVIGFTAITAIFVTRFSIAALPLLFLIQAILTIGGMVLFSFLNEFFPLKTLLAVCAFSAGLLLFAATFMLAKIYIFFALIFLAIGIFMPQLGIFLSSFTDDFFSPLEGERTYPIIESAMTIGGIFAGLLITSLSGFVSSYKFLYLWIILLFLMACVIFFLEPKTVSDHLIVRDRGKSFSLRSEMRNLSMNIGKIKAVPFLQTLFVIFLVQWIIAHLLEFQYTKVVEDSVLHLVSAEAREGGLTQGLGSLQILFHGSALAVQFLISSRILKGLGVIGSFLLHAIVTFFSAVSLLLSFGYFTVILAKNNFELSGIVHKNAYESSYFALKHGMQKSVREFFEAFIYPLGTIIGTLLILAIQTFVLQKYALSVIQFLFIFLSVFMISMTLYLQKTYTHLVREKLFNSGDQLSKLHAIEMLSQKGHGKNIEILLKALHCDSHSFQTKVKILETLGKIGDEKTIPDILHFLHHAEPQLVIAATNALAHFPKLGDRLLTQSFGRYRVLNELRNLFLDSHDEQTQIAVIKALAKLNDPEIVPFMLDILTHASPPLKAVCIRVCGLFHDSNAAFYLEPYLKDRDPHIEAQTIAALWQFKKYRLEVEAVFKKLLASKDPLELKAALSIMGDVGEKHDKKLLIPYLTDADAEFRLYAGFALLKLDYREAASYFAQLLLSQHVHIVKKAYELLQELKPDLKHAIAHFMKKEVSRRFAEAGEGVQERGFFEELLSRLKNIYLSIESYHDADFIDGMLQNKNLFSAARELLPATSAP